MFKQDDDEYQQQEEWERIQSENPQPQFDGWQYGGVDDSEQTAELSGDSVGGSGNENTANKI